MATKRNDWDELATAFVDINFTYLHLDKEKQEVSAEFNIFVNKMLDRLPPSRMRQVFLDYMLLAKDAAVRSKLEGQP